MDTRATTRAEKLEKKSISENSKALKRALKSFSPGQLCRRRGGGHSSRQGEEASTEEGASAASVSPKDFQADAQAESHALLTGQGDSGSTARSGSPSSPLSDSIHGSIQNLFDGHPVNTDSGDNSSETSDSSDHSNTMADEAERLKAIESAKRVFSCTQVPSLQMN